VIIVSNTSPIMNLAVVERLNILKQLYGRVIIPEAVLQELSITSPEQIRLTTIQIPSWIETRPVINRPLVDSLLFELDEGEAEAIALAIETKADILLLDERRGRKVASRFGLKFIGLLGILIEAKHKGIIEKLKPILNELVSKAGFRVSSQLYAHVLREAGE
jgi:predicted nucleic acid-binding protein